MKTLYSILLSLVMLVLWTSPVLAAVVAPTGTTNAATYITYSTVRLNATLTSDGGEACDGRFQYRESGGDWTDNETDWVEDTYLTGNSPWVDVTGLTPDTLHNFRVQFKNSHSTISGSSVDFTTIDAVSEPTGIKAYPKSTSILVVWTKGTGSTETTLRYLENTYPTSETEGTEGYEGILSSYTITGLTSGHTYYISAFGKSGTTYSAAYDTVMVTTSPAEAAVDEPDAPSMPPTWFQTPDYTKFSGMAGYALINRYADGLNMPRASFWLLSALLLCTLFGAIIYALGRHPMPAIIAVGVALGISSLVELLPMWMMAWAVIFIIGAIQLGHVRREE